METYDSYALEKKSAQSTAYAALMRNVYVWMTMALGVTALTAYVVAGNYNIMNAIFSNSFLFWGLIIAEVALVWILSATIDKMSFFVAGLMFVAYSVLNGVTLSCIFVIYNPEVICTSFLVTAGTFGAMAVAGSVTKKDLSGIGRFLLMALFGLIIATVVNIFVANNTLDWVITYAGVLIFCGLTAYDAQKIKNMLHQYGTDVNEGSQKMALMGSLSLYLDFINLFLYILRIFGRK